MYTYYDEASCKQQHVQHLKLKLQYEIKPHIQLFFTKRGLKKLVSFQKLCIVERVNLMLYWVPFVGMCYVYKVFFRLRSKSDDYKMTNWPLHLRLKKKIMFVVLLMAADRYIWQGFLSCLNPLWVKSWAMRCQIFLPEKGMFSEYSQLHLIRTIYCY